MSRDTVNALKASLWTALFTFAGVWSLSVLDWLNDVGRWASDHGQTPFPDISALGYAAVAAACSAAAFVVNAVVRIAQAQKIVPGRPPKYPIAVDERGSVTITEVALVAIALVVVLWALGAVPVD